MPGIEEIRIAPGLAPKLVRATMKEPAKAWTRVAEHVKVHHLDLSVEGHCSWYVEGPKTRVLALIRALECEKAEPLAALEIRCRPVQATERALISKRQFDTLATAIALGYYDIPHRVDLRALAKHTGVTLGAVSEMLRRAEAAVLTHYVDSSLLAWPQASDEPPNPFIPLQNLVAAPLVEAVPLPLKLANRKPNGEGHKPDQTDARGRMS